MWCFPSPAEKQNEHKKFKTGRSGEEWNQIPSDCLYNVLG